MNIIKQLQDQGFSLRGISKETGIGKTTVGDMGTGKRKIKPEEMKLLEALKEKAPASRAGKTEAQTSKHEVELDDTELFTVFQGVNIAYTGTGENITWSELAKLLMADPNVISGGDKETIKAEKEKSTVGFFVRGALEKATRKNPLQNMNLLFIDVDTPIDGEQMSSTQEIIDAIDGQFDCVIQSTSTPGRSRIIAPVDNIDSPEMLEAATRYLYDLCMGCGLSFQYAGESHKPKQVWFLPQTTDPDQYSHHHSEGPRFSLPSSMEVPEKVPQIEDREAFFGIISPEELKTLLDQLEVSIFHNNHDEWLNLMASCHHATGGEGAGVFVDWCITDPEYSADAEDIRYRFGTFSKEGSSGRPRTILTLVGYLGGKVPAEISKRILGVDFVALDPIEKEQQLYFHLGTILSAPGGEMAYEEQRKDLAKKYGVPVSFLDSYKRRIMQKIWQGADDLPDMFPEEEPWPDPISTGEVSELLRATSDRLSRMVSLPSQYTADMVALWVLLTYLPKCFRTVPYIFVCAPAPQCGKTTVLDFLESVCCRAHKTDNITAAGIFRLDPKSLPTLMIDELDTGGDKAELVNILNSGININGKSDRVEKQKGPNGSERYVTVSLPTFGPKCLGAIGRLSPQLESRCIFIPMKRATTKTKFEQLAADEIEIREDDRRKFTRWAADNFETVKAGYKVVVDEDDAIRSSNHRVKKCWEPILVMARVLGGTWPEQVTGAVDYAESVRDSTASLHKGERLLNDIEIILDAAIEDTHHGGEDIVDNRLLLQELNGCEEMMWGGNRFEGLPSLGIRTMGNILREFDLRAIKYQSNQKGEGTKTGYRVSELRVVIDQYSRR